MEHSYHRQGRSASSSPDRKARSRNRRRPVLEPLESRRLLTSISEFSTLPAENNNNNSEPLAIATGPDGNLWFADWGTGQIGMINPTTHQITTYSSGLNSDAAPQGIAAGPEGTDTLWFADSGNPSANPAHSSDRDDQSNHHTPHNPGILHRVTGQFLAVGDHRG